MKLTDLYYLVKPLIPRTIQIFVRRHVIRLMKSRYSNVWPIDRTSGAPPSGWKGWPDRKQFAFILTHDVESALGHERCRDLMRIEQALGFTSSFNFVPEKYEVSSILRNELTRNGFEVGVHDLKHDGKLFLDRKSFLTKAARINRYLREWGSTGFRAGSMHHVLDWIHALDIEYDASTFDLDPFEPQPGGVMTIFPFWVSLDGTGEGYVELPYTLPQDFTVFVLMREKNTDIWKKKLDWVASKGGMALLTTHPDYMCFDGGKPRFDQYPVGLFREFLKHVKSEYADRYWNVVPGAVCRHYREVQVRTS